jgi:polyisoprenoid-binding protein YceI
MRSMPLLTLLAVVGLAGLNASTAEAQARTFKVDAAASQIQFVSDAPLEKFSGTLSKASGQVVVDPAKPAGAKGNVKVEVATIKTGIDLRDEHVRNESWLDAAKYPTAEFVITSVSGVDKLKVGEAVEATVNGKFTLHGVTKDVSTKARVRLVPAEAGKPEGLRIVASFPIKLVDHKVSIPSIVALKVSPDIVVNVDLHATAN